MPDDRTPEVLLLIDTCGERASVALTRAEETVAEVVLPERVASAGLLGAVRTVLTAGQMSLPELSGLGVVRGPGSFTGVRVGLAAAKGLCEAADLRLAAVSRLAILAAKAGLHDGFAALRAGRDQVYLCEVQDGRALYEQLADLSDLGQRLHGRELICAEPALLPPLQQRGIPARLVELTAADALPLVRRCLAEGGSDLAAVDANYVRDEEAIYARPDRTS